MTKKLIDTVITVTPNPAVDFMLTAGNWQRGEVNKGQQSHIKAGGKGINVATALAELKVENPNVFQLVATGWLGEGNASIFVQHLQKHDIADKFIRIDGDTRTNIKITDNHVNTNSDIDDGNNDVDNDTTDFNFSGLTIAKTEQEKLVENLYASVTDSSLCVLAGSLPKGVDANFYANVIPLLRKNAHSIILDTSGMALQHVIKGNVFPQIMKPNIHELTAVSPQPLDSEQDIIELVTPWFNNGLELLVVSLGEKGALFISDTTVIKAKPPKVTITSTVGAGDAMVAGISYGLIQQLPLAEVARFATALSVAKITELEEGLTLVNRVQQLSTQINVTEITKS